MNVYCVWYYDVDNCKDVILEDNAVEIWHD